MSNEKKLGFNNDLIRRGERHFDLLAFKELLDVASEICLRDVPEYVSDMEPASSDEKMIHALGIRGLSVAFDVAALSDGVAIGSSGDAENTDDYINLTGPMRIPDLYQGDRFDINVQHNIQLFGESLLKEAYTSLGTDVNQKIAQFRDASTDEEQMEVLDWLMKRLDSFKKKSAHDIDGTDDEHFYHPIRLSPKILGQFPHNLYEPTCLGKTILVNSFLEKAGQDSLHSGVVRTRYESELVSLSQLFGVVFKRGDTFELTESVREKLLHKALDLILPQADVGFHTASIVRLQSGSWAVFDANFRRTYEIDEVNTQAIDQAFDDIHSLPGIYGIERTVDDLSNGLIDNALYYGIFHFLNPIECDAEQISESLRESTPESLLGDVRSCVKQIFTNKKWTDLDQLNDYINRLLYKNIFDTSIVNEDETIYRESLERAIESCFLWNESPEVICKQIEKDSSYLERKVKDVSQLPYLVLLNMALMATDMGIHVDNSTHLYHTLELGSPAYRIGAAVLSDFSTYTGANISYPFWLTHWASKVAITEHAPREVEAHHDSILHNNLFWLDQALPYYTQNGSIRKFVSDQRRKNGR